MVIVKSGAGHRSTPVIYVPESFHPENVLPPRLLVHTQAAYYLMHAIIVRLAYGQRRGARLKKQYLENVMGRWACQPILTALLDSGEIRRVGKYIPGKQSFGYLPSEQYRSQKVRQIYLTDPDLLGRLARVRRKEKERKQHNRRPIHNAWEQWQRQLNVQMDQARELIALLPVESNPYGIQEMMLDRIRRRKYRFIVDDFGRVHNAITSLCRPLRATLRMKGQSMSHVDLVNAQPALLALLEREERQLPTTAPARGRLPVQVSIYDRRGFSPLGGKLNYESLVTEGRLYEYLMAKTGMTRADIKRALLADVFGRRRWYPSLLEDVFRDCFPEVYRFIRSFNRDDPASLLRALQRVESDLVIHQVGRRLQELKCTGCVSLHDAVFCARRDLGLVERAFSDVFEETGVCLKLRVEW